MHSRLILTALIALSSLPALADTTTVTTDITISTTTSGPVTCDMVLDSQFVNTSMVTFTPPFNRFALRVRGIVSTGNVNHINISATVEVLGETGSTINNAANVASFNAGGSPLGFTNSTGPNNTVYNFGLTSGVFSGSISVAGAFANGMQFSLIHGDGSSIVMHCFGHGSAKVFFNGTLSQN